MINNGKTLNRLWAALTSDFEVLLGKYLDSPCWEFEDFAQLARGMELSLIMNMALGRGKSKDEHYHIISTVIFDAAKRFWLRPRNQQLEDDALQAKRKVGGFFITYVMYLKQPYPGRTKIILNKRDLRLVNEFIHETKPVTVQEEVMFALLYLVKNNAFTFSFVPYECGVESWRRIMLTNQKSELVQKSFKMRDIHDPLAYGSDLHRMDKDVMKFMIHKTKICDAMKRSLVDIHINPIMTNKNETLNMLLMSEGVQKVQVASKELRDLTREPILTLEQLTCTDSIDRRILAETRRRIERQRKKILELPGKTSNPYVREGGIYGRKKEIDEEKENRERRERGMCSGNLWTYINGLTFDKPLGHLPTDDPNNLAPKA